MSISSQTIPPLKQKTGIIKSKVPPPVPPRGSPRVDRRQSASSHISTGVSPSRGTPPSSGSQNYLNDKYFNTIQPNSNNMCRLTPQKLYKKPESNVPPTTPIPIFGERRSPSCVRDWLEINDFAASNYDENALEFRITEPIKEYTIKPRRPLPIKTAHLQLQSSFRISNSSGSSVRSMVKNFSKLNDKKSGLNKVANGEKIDKSDSVSDRIKSYNKSLQEINNNYKNQNHRLSIDINSNVKTLASRICDTASAPNIAQNYSKPKDSPAKIPMIKVDNSDSVFNSLKRKKETTCSHNIDENSNVMATKLYILKSLSNHEDSSHEDSKYLDAFSLDGEFV